MPDSEDSTLFPIVGIGASAGGLEAFLTLLKHLDVDTGMGFVLIQHLDPSHPSLLTSILAKATKMPVTEARDGLLVEPNCVYVIPPNMRMTLVVDTLHLETRTSQDMHDHYTIDEFFFSLATARKSKAVGVILSGSDSDGTKGLEAIRAVGGLTFAQDLESAKFDAMPTAASANGIDFILPPEELAKALGEFSRGRQFSPQSTAVSKDPFNPSWDSLQKVLTLLGKSRGVDFSHYKLPTIQRRILRRMAIWKLEGVDEYFQLLKSNHVELDTLYEDILIKVTSFFRDTETFEALKLSVLPDLFSQRPEGSTIRVWVAGCATGEEAYSLAILLSEYAEEVGQVTKIEIFATDISDHALNTARAGYYSDKILETVSEARLNRFFSKDGSRYRILSSIRELCVFAKQNISEDPPFSKIDLVSCRNLMIYLAPIVQRRVISALHFALNPHGFLLLGSSESVGLSSDSFEVWDKNVQIYCKKSALTRSFPEYTLNAPALRSNATIQLPVAPVDRPKNMNISDYADRAIVAGFVPSGVVIDDDYNVHQFRGDTSPFLLHPPGDLTASLLKMCRPGIIVGLRAGLVKANATGLRVSRRSWLKEGSKKSIAIKVEIIPFKVPEINASYFAVLFAVDTLQKPTKIPSDSEDNNIVHMLELELSETKEYLSNIIKKEQLANEELKAVSEEIQSANEELQSTNEEMSTAKEELQAANEELITVNDELQSRNKDLEHVTDDLSNLFGCVQIPILMLSSNLAVRRFTPSAEKVLNLGKEDLGRSLNDFGSRLNVAGLDRLVTEVLQSLNTREEDIQDRNGRWYSLRIKPYRTQDNKIDGTVVTLVDIDTMKRSFDHLKEAFDYAEAIIQTAPIPLVSIDETLRIVTANRAFYHDFKISEAEAVNKQIYNLGSGEWNSSQFKGILEAELMDKGAVEDFVFDQTLPNSGQRTVQLNAKRIAFFGGEAARIVLALRDITAEKQAGEEIELAMNDAQAANQAKSDFLANMSHEIRTPLAAILGYSELLGNQLQKCPEVTTSLSRIRKNVEQLTELIDEILDISKIEAGKLEVERISFDLMPELAETFSFLQNRAEAKGLSFNVAFEGEIPTRVSSCPKKLRQILINMIGNALKFTDTGTVKILVKLSVPAGPQQTKLLSFTVIDSGCGLSEAQQARLFQPFSQGDTSVTRRFGGTGLGLILSRQLAEALGGDVVLSNSSVNIGSTFTITIDPGPLEGVPMLSSPERTALIGKGDSASDWLGESKKLDCVRVLLVEDGPDNIALMSQFLTASGATVEIAHNGAEAINLALLADHDIVLMDIQMPILDGYEATKQLRATGYETPIVALTAHAMRGERERCLAIGCNDYVSKPVKPNALIGIVERIVKEHTTDMTMTPLTAPLSEDPVLAPIIRQFINNLPQRVAAIREAQRRLAWPEVANLAHQMLGAAGSYGYPEIGKAAGRIEVLGRYHPDPKVLEQAISAFAALCTAATAPP